MKALKNSLLPRCFILNKIGEISIGDNGEAKEARDFLSGLLKSNEPSDRFYAFCWLSGSAELDQETLDKIEEFKADPNSGDIISQAEESMRARRS